MLGRFSVLSVWGTKCAPSTYSWSELKTQAALRQHLQNSLISSGCDSHGTSLAIIGQNFPPYVQGERNSNPQLHNVSALISQWRTHGLRLSCANTTNPNLTQCLGLRVHFRMLTRSCQSFLLAGYTSATSRKDTTPVQPSIWLEILKERRLAGKNTWLITFFFLNCLSHKDRVLWLRHQI